MTSQSSGFPPSELKDLISQISDILRRDKKTIAVVETACGGLISSSLLSVPGASAYYRGGTLVYSLESRLKLSGWSEADVKSYTGPSEDVVTRLARNIKMELNTTYSLAESGTAGPSSGSGHEPGTVFLAIQSGQYPNTKSKVVHTGVSDRAENMVLFAKAALEFLIEILHQDESSR